MWKDDGALGVSRALVLGGKLNPEDRAAKRGQVVKNASGFGYRKLFGIMRPGCDAIAGEASVLGSFHVVGRIADEAGSGWLAAECF